MRTRNEEMDANGRFKRTHAIWTPENWEDGVLMNKGRVAVFRPDYPRAWASGYALRSHIVWWLRTGEALPPGEVLHHANAVKTDDRFENLVRKTHSRHSSEHAKREAVELTCRGCGGKYTRTPGYARHHQGFCSQDCYHAFPQDVERRARVSASLKRAYAEGRRSATEYSLSGDLGRNNMGKKRSEDSIRKQSVSLKETWAKRKAK
jgi:hypothetical protein